MLRIWGRKNSSNVRKTLWIAEALGVPCERKPLPALHACCERLKARPAYRKAVVTPLP